MNRKGRCRVCHRIHIIIVGRSVLNDAPIPYCEICLDNNAESFAMFKEYYIAVSGDIDNNIKEITIFYKGQYISYDEAVAIVLL